MIAAASDATQSGLSAIAHTLQRKGIGATQTWWTLLTKRVTCRGVASSVQVELPPPKTAVR